MKQNTVRVWPKRYSDLLYQKDKEADSYVMTGNCHFERYMFAANFFSRHKFKIIDAAYVVGYGSSILHHFTISDIYGYDISNEAIDHAKKYYENDSGPFFRLADLNSDLDLSCDVLITFETLEHLKDPLLFLKKINAKYLIASVPNEDLYPFNPETFKGDEFPHQRHYSPQQFEDLLNLAGFEVKKKFCQENKFPGQIKEGTQGIFLIYFAEKE